jgi:hypothetical protein
MRIEVIHGRKLVCGHIFPKDQIHVGEEWAQADGTDRVVTICAINVVGDDVWVEYSVPGEDRTNEKDWFNFQCRYCKVVS